MAHDEAGFSMPELLAALPLLLLLGFAMLNVFGMGSKYHRDFLGDWALLQQVRFPMEEIAKDVRYCGEMRLERPYGDMTVLYIKRHYLTPSDAASENYWQRYKFIRRGEEDYWITKNDQPVLGRTAITDIRLDRCECQLLAEGKVRVLISGINMATGHSFRLERTLYSYGYGMEPARESDEDG